MRTLHFTHSVTHQPERAQGPFLYEARAMHLGQEYCWWARLDKDPRAYPKMLAELERRAYAAHTGKSVRP